MNGFCLRCLLIKITKRFCTTGINQLVIMDKTERIFIIDIFIMARKAFLYLLSKWLVIFIVALLAGLAGIFYAWSVKPVYTAELVFSSEAGGEGGLGGYAGLAAQFGLDLGGGGGGAFEGDNLMELLRSHSILQNALLSDAKNFGPNKLMIDAYLDNHEINKNWKDDPKFKHVKFVKPPFAAERVRDSVMKATIKNIIDGQLSISKIDKKLNYIKVEMKDVNEVFAKDFVKILMDNASAFYINYKSKRSRTNFNLIYRLTDSVRGLLYGNIEQYASKADLNLNPLRQIAKTGSQKIQVNAQANTALYTELLKQLGLAQISLQKVTPLIQVIDEPMLPLKKKKPGRLLMGIVFAFVGGGLFVIYLLLRKWIREVDGRFNRSSTIAK